MKYYLIVFMIATVSAFGVNRAAFDGLLEARQISDSIFVVGIFMFFLGLIAVTGSGKVFSGFSYTFNIVFKRKEMKNKSYYEFVKEDVRVPVHFARAVFFNGILFVIAALLIH